LAQETQVRCGTRRQGTAPHCSRSKEGSSMTTRARLALNDNDIAEALDQLCEQGMIPDEIGFLIASLAEELAEKRLQKEDEACKS
jgi:hypothetical protein